MKFRTFLSAVVLTAVIASCGGGSDSSTGRIKNAALTPVPVATAGTTAVTALISETGVRSLKVKWTAKANSNTPAPVAFMVEACETSCEDSKAIVAGSTVVGASALDAFVPGLKTDTNYGVRVIAMGSTGPLGLGLTTTRTQWAPTSASATPSVDSALISWTAPVSQESQGNLKFVGGRFDTIPSGDVGLSGTLMGNGAPASSWTMRGLKQATDYWFKLWVSTNIDSSPAVWVRFKTTGTAPTTVPGTVPCKSGGPCKIGDITPAGGTVFYVAPAGTSWGKYLEAAPRTWNGGTSDPELSWCTGFPDANGAYKSWGSTATNVGAGKSNFALMMAKCPASPAGLAVRALTLGGKNDWFIPSIEEAKLICGDPTVIGRTTADYYTMSSTESDNKMAQACRTGNTSLWSTFKLSRATVIPVRIGQ